MALNLSTLTNASTSATVLAEAQTTADFLDSVPILKNIARGSNKGGDGKQTTALNQPKALPVVDGKGYLYLSGVSGNYADVPVFDIGALDDFTIQVDGLDAGSVRPAATVTPISYFGVANTNRSFILQISTTGQIKLYLYLNGVTGHTYNDSTAVPTNTIGIRITRVGTVLTYWVDSGSGYVSHDTDTIATTPLYNPVAAVSVNVGQYSGGDRLTGKISRAVIWDNGTQAGTPVLDVDFTATNIRHNDTKFQCATGQTVTINQAGNDPATVIKKSVLRFSSATSGLKGLFANQIDGGYMFAAFSVLGTGVAAGASNARVFSVNKTSVSDANANGAIFSLQNGTSNNLRLYAGGHVFNHELLYDDDNGDVLHQSKIANGTQFSKVNNADQRSQTFATAIEANEFNLGVNEDGIRANGENAAIDLEYLALFPATITTDEAARVVTYINTRNTVFDLKDSLGYYFFDPQVFPNASPAAFVSYWNGNIVGSDNTLNSAVTQTVAIDQPTRDGFKIGFTSNTDHLDIPSTTQAGWQIVGTSLGTFAYRVNANAVTELNLLGNFGHATYRKAGDLYGIILLPETATGADIEAARKLLIDRGASDGVSGTLMERYFSGRQDIVNFNHIETSNVTQMWACFLGCSNIVSYPLIDTTSVTSMGYAFQSNNSLESFPAIQAPLCTDFQNAWQGCSALTSFPAGAKLGTEASNVNFSLAFYLSGLTSLPDNLDMSQGGTFVSVFQSTPITSIGTGVLLGTAAASPTVNFASAFQSCASLAALPDNLDLSQGDKFNDAFYGCTSLATIGTGVLLGTAASNVNFTSAFRISGLTELPAGLDMSKGFTFASAFRDCTSLTTIGSGVLLGTAYATATVSFADAFRSCTNLVTLPANLNLSKGNYFYSTFRDCSSLVTFPAGAFDTMGTPPNWCFAGTWQGNTALSGASVDAILSSIDTSGQSAPGTGPDITIDYNVATGALSAATNTAINSLIGKGWRVYINGVLTIPNVLSLAPAAAYSLRSFDSAADPNVVNVRRSSDSATSDFKASEVSDGTLTTWVGSGDGHVTTWYDQGGTNHAAQATASSQPKIVDGGVLVTEGGLPSINFPTEVSNLSLNHSDLYGQATLDSYYVTNATGNEYIYPSLRTISTVFGMTAAASSFTQLSAGYGSPAFYGNGTQITGTTRTEIRTATSGGQKLVSHIGANTESSNWSNYNMNFGNYFNADSYSYTGKLQEMIFFNTDQSANRTGIEKNINDTYTIY